ncbi:DUF1292 domain-containing protein [Caldalkalibacillus mannanilyticus]|uniref:DUF1292 domain-containing protein n=1 Tax=Caldalkalibacillus mannanilyticus TaxID=1418 RepID=UPI00046AEED2|nr:DUF1292 domain-containing protein [Caldalkalibacillus mannanilyticus]
MSEFNEELDVETIIIPDEDGNENEFEVYMKFDVPSTGKQYMILIPLEEGEVDIDEDEVVAFRYEENGDEYSLFFIEDDEEWEIVDATFQTLQEEVLGQSE